MTRNRKLILPLGVLLAVFALAAIVMLVRASADDLLHQSARLLADTTAGHAKLSFEFDAPEKSGRGAVEVWGRKDAGPNGEPAFRVVVLDAGEEHAEAVGSVAVSDGAQVWFYRKDKNIVYTGTVEEMKARLEEGHGEELTGHDLPDYNAEDMPQTAEEAVDKLLEYFEAERTGTVEINEMKAYQLRLVPIPEQMPDEFRANGGLFDILLRTDDSAPLGVEFSGAAVGSGKITASVLKLYQGQDDIDDSLFTYVIPAGAAVVQLADLEPPSLSFEEAADLAEFDVLTPDYLPAAARLEGINEVRGAVVQRYRLPDGASFTIAQGAANAARTPDGVDGEAVTVNGFDSMLYQDDGGTRTLLTWSNGEVNVWIGGDLSAETAIKIANSLN
jgi:outer membrane lipoprotein-sorting protein